MEKNTVKEKFIQLRGTGKCYGVISAALDLSQAECETLEKELQPEIDEVTRKQRDELYRAYEATPEARIKNMGETLKRINKALEPKDFSDLSTVELLDMQLRYMNALVAIKDEIRSSP